MSRYLLSLDQGTTSSRAILFSEQGRPIAQAQHEFPQSFPQPGWVEHNPNDLWQTILNSVRDVLEQFTGDTSDIAALGITNQRETTLIWDRATGEAIYPAIVWQDRRTSGWCQQLQSQSGVSDLIKAKTGLLLDPYFSASKIAWILDAVDGARERAERGELAFGTVDSYLLWQLTDGQCHATDATNASRTLLFDIHSQQWDDELLALFNIPKALLPDVKDSAADYGRVSPVHWGAETPIYSLVGDQQAALIGQACFQTGMVKSTYGTGCFMVMNTGDQIIESQHRLLTTLAYRLNGQACYALEGSIFMAGATIQWIRDGLKLIADASDSQPLAEATGYENPVYMVPAFTGLGAPHWDPDAKGAILGLTRDTGIKEVVTAGLQAVCYQTRDLLEAMASDGVRPAEVRVDGGMVVNDWLMQCLSDTLSVDITRAEVTETTALGAAFLAGLQAGIFRDLSDIQQVWKQERVFSPELDETQREQLYHGWKQAVQSVRATVVE